MQDLFTSTKVFLRLLNRAEKKLQNSYLVRKSRIQPTPIIIIGNQKTGTSAIAALLAEATGSSVTIDFFHRVKKNFFREELFGQTILLRDFIQNNKSYFTTDIIKEPSLTFLFEQLIMCFPKSSFVFVNRDPRDNIRSILNRLEIPGNLTTLDDFYTNNWSENMHGWKAMLEGKLPTVQGTNYVERIAKRWCIAADTYLSHKDNMVYISYENFIKDKVGSIRWLARQVQLEPRYSIADKINVPYQPPGNHNVSWIEFFGSNNLKLIETTCHEQMRHFGYKLSDKLQNQSESHQKNITQ